MENYHGSNPDKSKNETSIIQDIEFPLKLITFGYTKEQVEIILARQKLLLEKRKQILTSDENETYQTREVRTIKERLEESEKSQNSYNYNKDTHGD